MTRAISVGMCLAVLATACAGELTPPLPPLPPEQAQAEGEERFEDGLALIQRHDAAGWSDEDCRSVATALGQAAQRLTEGGEQDAARAARYNQAIALTRCSFDDDARVVLESIVAEEPSFPHARAQLAIMSYAAHDISVDEAISELDRAVHDGEYKDADILVDLAILQTRKGGEAAREEAHMNLRRALATHDSYMPAYNQLAIHHLDGARAQAARGEPNVATLELAALVVSQGLKKTPDYAPLHNTAGLISTELEDLGAAARSFDQARQLRPEFFEAHMNFAAVNAQFRGFARAEAAYRAALKLRPDDYDAQLGLALALRGQIPERGEAAVKEAADHIRRAKELDPQRPEAYFNEAVLEMEFAHLQHDNSRQPLKRAQSLLEAFLVRAGDGAAYSEHVERARQRLADIKTMLEFPIGS